MQLSKLNSKPVFWYTLGTIIRQLAAFIMLPIYTQHLSPAEYGIVGLLAMILGLYELFLGARFGGALPKFFYDAENEDRQKVLISSALIFTSFFSVLGAIIFSLSAQPIAVGFFERPDLVFAVSVYGILLVTTSIEEYALVFLRLKDKPFYFFCVSVLKLILQLGLNIYFVVVIELGVQGVIFGNIIASAALALATGLYTLAYSKCRFDIRLAKSLLSFTWPIWLAGFGSMYINLIINYFIKYYVSLDEVGIYHFSMKFSMLIILILWQPFNQWWQTERFKIAINSKNAKAEFTSAFILISSILMLGSVGVSLFSGIVIDLMADDSYASAKYFVPILCLSVLTGQMNLFINFAFLKSEKTGYLPKITAMKAVLITLLVAFGARYWGLQGALYALIICHIFEFVSKHIVGNKYYDQGTPIVWFYAMSAVTGCYIFIALEVVGIDSSIFYRIVGFTLACMFYLIALLTVLFVFSSKGKNIVKFIRN